MEWLQIVWGLVFGYLFIWSAYLFVFAFAGLFYKTKTKMGEASKNTYAVIVPAYKEDAIIVKSVKENLSIDFPKDRYKLFVVAESLQESTLEELHKLPIKIVEISSINPTKAKAVNAALEFITLKNYSHVIVLDADNVMNVDYLQKVSVQMSNNIQALQTHRKAKNSNGAVSVLDAINEEVGNHIFRKGHIVLGFSSALIGSGMVFKTELFARLMAPIRDTAGEDKMLEFALLQEKIKVQYQDDALVFDEKIEKQEQFEGQRSRWVAARFYFLKSEARKSLIKLSQLDFDYFNKWLQFLLPQKIVLVVNVILFSSLSILFSVNPILAMGLIVLLVLAFALSIPKEYYSFKTVKAIFSIPAMVFGMAMVLLNINKVDPSKFNVTSKEA